MKAEENKPTHWISSHRNQHSYPQDGVFLQKTYIFALLMTIKNMKRYVIIALLTFLLKPFVPLHASDFLFKQLSIPEGIPASIQSIYAEKNSFVWIGTKRGLGRFDGYELKLYTHDDSNPYSLPGDEIYQITEDSLHNIWILTNQGLATYDKRTNRFIKALDDREEPIVATATCKTKEGILFCTRNSLFKYLYAEKTVRKMVDYHMPTTHIKEIWPWDNNHVLCVRLWQGISLLDLHTGEMKPAPLEDSDQMTRILIDSKKRIWGTAYNKGITCFDTNGYPVATYNTHNSALTHNIVLCMSEYKGQIWIGTDGGGINILDPETQTFTTLTHIPGDHNSLPDNSIQCFYQGEDEDNIWVGSVKGGLINIRESFVRFYSDVPLNTATGLSEKAVLSIYQAPRNDEVWIGTDGGGINKYNPQTRRFTHYPKTWSEKFTSICQLNANELFVSLFSKGLFIFNKQTGSLRKLQGIDVIDQLALYGRKAINLYQDQPGSILILSTEVFRYYPATKKIKQLTHGNFPIEGQLIVAGQDSLYTYLYDLHHIYTLNRRNDQIQKLYSSETEDDAMEAVCLTPHGDFWIGSPKGLSLYNPRKQTQTSVNYPQLGNITSLIYDNRQRLWIGTEKHLFVWLPDTKKLISLDESDGIQPNEYTKKAVLNSSQGEVFLGGINGLVCIDGNIPEINIPLPPTLSLADAVCNNKSVLGELDEHTHRLMLKNEDRTLTIKIMAHTNNRFGKRTYRWYINGIYEQTSESHIPEITLRSLTPGTYEIKASCTTKDNIWIPSQHIVTFVIPPAWYQTWWFITLCIAAVTAGLIYAILRILRRKEERMVLALKEHKQKVYEEKVRFLININHELRTPLTLIQAPLSQVLQKISPDDTLYPTLKNVLKQAKRMKSLLNMVLNLRKMEMEESKLQMHPHSLNEWLKDTAGDFTYEGHDKNIHMVYQLDPAIGEVNFDLEKNTIILTNLIVNAFKHSPEGSTITLRTELVENGSFVRISVVDQGCGLKDIDAQKLFTRFYQGEKEKGGTGIGLSYAKILVEQHHGRIGAYNNADRGACFYYELPLAQETGPVVCQPQEYLNAVLQTADIAPCNSIVSSIDTQNYSCLFVDDNEDMRNMIAEAFKTQFKKLYIAPNGQKALQIVLNEIPDIVVSDVMMPVMNGYELCRNIKENMNINHIQVILLTARTDEQSHLDGYKTGADAYLEKPFEINTLLETIKNRLFLREQIKLRYTLTTVVPEANEKPVNSADDAFLYKLNRLIVDHMDNEELNIAFLCKEMGLSRASLYNRVKMLTDIGPNEYINKLRMEKAAELLRQTDLSITLIAERTGFTTSRYFSTAFKKYMGTTPTQYKSQYSVPPLPRQTEDIPFYVCL